MPPFFGLRAALRDVDECLAVGSIVLSETSVAAIRAWATIDEVWAVETRDVVVATAGSSRVIVVTDEEVVLPVDANDRVSAPCPSGFSSCVVVAESADGSRDRVISAVARCDPKAKLSPVASSGNTGENFVTLGGRRRPPRPSPVTGVLSFSPPASSSRSWIRGGTKKKSGRSGAATRE
jgi:hypothetical protein